MIGDANNFDRGFDGWWWIRGQCNDRYMTNPTTASIERQKALVLTNYLQNTSLQRFEDDIFVAKTMNAAIKWLELNYNQHEKFFLHVDVFDPHEPWDPPKWYSDMYDSDWNGEEVIRVGKKKATNFNEDELRHLRAFYAGEVTMVDRWIGNFLQKIEDLGLFKNTTVILTSDHGTYLGEHSYVHKVVEHNHLYEEVAHIPLIVRLPESYGINRGRCETLVQPPDLMPTILEIGGVKLPQTVQGTSLLPIMQDKEKQIHKVAVSSGSLLVPFFKRITVTSMEWSLILTKSNTHQTSRRGAKMEPELYHLTKDPKQTLNLYDEESDVVEELKLEMIRFLESVGTKKELIRSWNKKQD
jgi:arylsulfatase A-like enzyme